MGAELAPNDIAESPKHGGGGAGNGDEQLKLNGPGCSTEAVLMFPEVYEPG